MSGQSLFAFLNSGAFAERENHGQIAGIILSLAATAVEVRKLITHGALNAAFATSRDVENAGGDVQKDLDVVADGLFLQAMQGKAVALYGSEENAQPILLDPEHSLALAIDPLDGSSNIETNVSIGTIFSILPVAGDPRADPRRRSFSPARRNSPRVSSSTGRNWRWCSPSAPARRIFIHSSRYGDFIEGL